MLETARARFLLFAIPLFILSVISVWYFNDISLNPGLRLLGVYGVVFMGIGLAACVISWIVKGT